MDNIKIAICMDAKGPLGLVPPLFAQSAHVLFMESRGIVRELLARQGESEADLARRIVDWGCECVLCGPIAEEPFLILADEGGVTRYNAAGLSLDNALKAFKADKLELIRDYIGGTGCQSEAEAGRECREHD